MGFLNRIFKKNDLIYICYDKDDEKVAREVCEVLEYNGLLCWLKDRDHGNDNIIKEVINTISKSGLCIVIHSKNSADSAFLNNEVDTAFSKNVPLCVFNVDSSKITGGLEFFLKNGSTVNAYGDYRDNFEELVIKSMQMLGRPSAKVKLPEIASKHSIFISYSTKDAEMANRLCNELENNGFKCWIAPRNIKSDTIYSEQIPEAINDAGAMLSVFSKNYQQSKFTRNEATLAFSDKTPIIAFKIDDSMPEDDIETILRTQEWIDAEYHGFDKGFDELISLLSRILDKNTNIASKPETPALCTNDIFISYSTMDHEIAEMACERLEGEGFKCWIAPRDIETGANFAEEIVTNLKGSRLLLAIFSKNYQQSKYTKVELEQAFSNQKPIVALRTDDTFPEGELEFMMRTANWADGNDDLNTALDSLIQAADYNLGRCKSSLITIECESDECLITDTAEISGRLTDDDGNPLSSTNIMISLDGTDIENIRTSDDGSYSSLIDFDEIGIKQIEASFEGSRKYSSCSADLNIEVLKLDAEISIAAASDIVPAEGMIALTGSLKHDGKPLSRANVDIYDNMNLVDTVVTSNAGNFSMLIPAENAEKHDFKAVFNESDLYNPCESPILTVEVVSEEETFSKDDETTPNPDTSEFKAYDGEEKYIFISYKHLDKEIIYPIIKRFHDLGFKIWYDDGLKYGDDYDDLIDYKIDKCALFLIFITERVIEKAYDPKEYMKKELDVALETDTKILPVFIDDVKLKGKYRMQLRGLHSIFKFEYEDENEFIENCIDAFTNHFHIEPESD